MTEVHAHLEYGVQLSLSLPPVAQYAKGDMLNIRGETAEVFKDRLEAVRKMAEEDALLARFFEAAEKAALEKVEKDLDADEADEDYDVAEEPSVERTLDGITDKQKKLVFQLKKRHDISDEKLMAWASKEAGGKVRAISDLTKKEASALIDRLIAYGED